MCTLHSFINQTHVCIHKKNWTRNFLEYEYLKKKQEVKNMLYSIGPEVICLDGFISIHFIILFKLNSCTYTSFCSLHVYIVYPSIRLLALFSSTLRYSFSLSFVSVCVFLLLLLPFWLSIYFDSGHLFVHLAS